MSSSDRRLERGTRTRQALVQAARRLFRHGYDAVGTPEIVRAAEVTRGALYHHFDDKRALFAAVVEEIARDLVADIEAVAQVRGDRPLDAVVAGCRAFLAATRNEERRQILLIDAPAVLGWRAWRAIDARHGLGSLQAGLQACADAGLMDAADVLATAYLISGALNEAAFVLADAGDREPIARALDQQMERMVRSLICEGPKRAAGRAGRKATARGSGRGSAVRGL